MKIPLSSNSVGHIGLIVRDIEESAKKYEKFFGIRVPGIGETATADKTHIVYRGGPTQARAKLCHIPMGPIRIELIQPLGGPSVWKDFLDSKGEGVQHVAFDVKDADAEVARLEAEGFKVVQRGDFEGGCYIYVDTTAELGVCLELLGKK